MDGKSVLELKLLGSPQVKQNEQILDIQWRKVQALLFYLVVSGEWHQRATLATLLWPESDEQRAYGSLRRRLSELKRLLDDGWLEMEGDAVRLVVKPGLRLDVAEFQDSLATCQAHDHPIETVCPRCLAPLTTAVTLYRGDFLAGFTLPDAPDFDAWQRFQTEELRFAYASALDRLVEGHQTQNNLSEAIAYARRRLNLDPLYEPVHRRLMRLYMLSGQQSAALRQYQLCVQTLEDELGLPPSAETRSLYEQIRGGEMSQSENTTAALPHQSAAWLIGGRYEIMDKTEDLIGQGGMGQVFKGRDIETDQAVAIKVLRTDALADEADILERFAREGEALRQLNHPNIVQLLDMIRADEQYYLVMEYVAGGSLRDWLDRSERLSLAQVLQIAIELCDALTQTPVYRTKKRGI